MDWITRSVSFHSGSCWKSAKRWQIKCSLRIVEAGGPVITAPQLQPSEGARAVLIKSLCLWLVALTGHCLWNVIVQFEVLLKTYFFSWNCWERLCVQKKTPPPPKKKKPAMCSVGGDWEEEKGKEGKEEKRKRGMFPIITHFCLQNPKVVAVRRPSPSPASGQPALGEGLGCSGGRGPRAAPRRCRLPGWAQLSTSRKSCTSHTSPSLEKLIRTSAFFLKWEFSLLLVSILNAKCPVLYCKQWRHVELCSLSN